MNISRTEQRVLHVLARGGEIRHFRNEHGKIVEVLFVTHDGRVLADCTLAVFSRLRRRRLVLSVAGAPYRISRLWDGFPYALSPTTACDQRATHENVTRARERFVLSCGPSCS